MKITPEFNVEILDFAGPLEILWSKLSLAEVGMGDLNIVAILQQYESYINFCLRHHFQIGSISKHLLMCSKMILWKSQLLLPEPVVVMTDEVIQQSEQERIRQLTLYSQVKQLAAKLKDASRQNAHFLGKEASLYSEATAAKVKPQPFSYLNQLDINHLTKALSKTIDRFQYHQQMETQMLKQTASPYLIKQQILGIYAAQANQDQHFEVLLLQVAQTLAELLTAFLVVLELVMQGTMTIIYTKQLLYLRLLPATAGAHHE